MRDLSIITDHLRDILTAAVNSSPIFGGNPPPFSVTVSGQHPQTPAQSDCELNIYLFHVAPNKYLANSFWSAAAQHGTTPAVAAEPLSLDLWYMLSAQSKTSYVQEQRILGVAMQCLHENAVLALNTPTPLPGAVTPSHATVVLESPSFDELSRLWQAFGLPLRTTAQYRVSVAFLTPDVVPADAPDVQVVNLVAAPLAAETARARLFSTRRTLVYTAPGPIQESVQLSPATTAPAPGPAAAAQEVVLDGAGVLPGDHVVLVSYPGGVRTEADITATWAAPGDPPFRLTPPAGAGAPAPGRHELLVTRPSEPGWRSNAVPLSVAAWIDPSGGPLVNANPQGRYSLTVAGVPAGGVVLRIGTTALTRIADGGTPAAGEWQSSAGALTFAAPVGTSAGTHLVGLRANDVEADPVKWAVV